jgi:hypothetical protein
MRNRVRVVSKVDPHKVQRAMETDDRTKFLLRTFLFCFPQEVGRLTGISKNLLPECL